MIEIFDIEQNTDAWKLARCGIPTASQFKTVLASGKGGGESVGRRKYLYQLAGEIVSGIPMESYGNGFMDRGHRMEEELRNYYAFLADAEPERVGFIRNGQKGCSPDALLGSNGLLEIKSHAPHLLIDLLFKDEFPPEHKPQTQGQLLVAEREFIDIICGYTGMPPLVKRAYRDSFYIKKLSDAIDQFNDELAETVERIKRYSPSIPALEHAA